MGVVYEAFDAERNMPVALKTLRNIDAASLYRFKREFRSLSDISHPNIIGLYELVSEGNDWFFTMELLTGSDIVSYIRPLGWVARGRTTDADSVGTSATDETRSINDTGSGDGRDLDGVIVPTDDEKLSFSELVDERRLRRGLAQLAQALDMLHRSGMIHRDLKPSNVMVTDRERIVLMDFGVVAEITTSSKDDSSEGRAIGTPAYMAPEQAAGRSANAAADWYSFGVVLYLILTGRLPFAGAKQAVLIAKQSQTPPPPRLVADGIPEDLESLCCDLLSITPADRPSGQKVMERLGVAVQPSAEITTTGGISVFVGREHEQEKLMSAYDRMREGEGEAVFVVGRSGMGKSTLVRRFLQELEVSRGARDMPVVLRGRCHERESLPYKGFDTIVDSLSSFLLNVSDKRVESLLPEDVDLLTRLFPVLRQIPGVQTSRPYGGLDPQELRARAFGVFRELLRRVVEWRPLILYIDDLQWADDDSLDLLIDLLRSPSPPQLMLLAAVRAENLAGEEDVPGVRGVGEIIQTVSSGFPATRIDVGPLSDEEQRLLVERLMGGEATPERMERQFWRESAGSPFFVGELVRYARELGDELPTEAPPKLEQVLYSRMESIPDKPRKLLEAVAVAGEPTALSILANAVDLDAADRERCLAILRVGNLVRAARHGQDPWITTYHDRIRETLTARLTADRLRDLHQRLAQALERSQHATVDALARHWLAAEDAHQAVTYLVSAAEAAVAKLAFGRAADLYRVALELHAVGDRRLSLTAAMADALAQAGRSSEAAEAYQAAAGLATSDKAAELTRLAADNLLRGGHVDEGLALFHDLMGHLGMSFARSGWRALLSLVFQRGRMMMRGLRYKATDESAVAARDLGRLDTLYAASTTMGMIDHVRGADLQTRHLLQALKYGEKRRVCRAMAIEVVFRAASGGRSQRKALTMSRDVEAFARRLGEPYLLGVAKLGVGAANFFGARARPAADAFREAERIFSTDVSGAEWERVTARFFLCNSQVGLGELDQVASSAKRFLDEAERRNDVYSTTMFRTQPSTWRWLLADQPEKAMEEANLALEGWPSDKFYMVHHLSNVSKAIVMLYQHRHAEAFEILRSELPGLRKSQIVRIPWVMAEYRNYMARAALYLDDRGALKRIARFLDGFKFPVGDGVSASIRAALAFRAGDEQRAIELLLEATSLCDQGEFHCYATGFRYRLGEHTPGAEGERLRRDALEWFSAQGAEKPLRMIEIFAPPLAAPRKQLGD